LGGHLAEERRGRKHRWLIPLIAVQRSPDAFSTVMLRLLAQMLYLGPTEICTIHSALARFPTYSSSYFPGRDESDNLSARFGSM